MRMIRDVPGNFKAHLLNLSRVSTGRLGGLTNLPDHFVEYVSILVKQIGTKSREVAAITRKPKLHDQL